MGCLDGQYFNGIKLKRVYSGSYADITVEWAKDLQGHFIGKWLDCSNYKNEMDSTYNECYVPGGSIFVLYNSSRFGIGNDIPIDIKIIDKSSAGIVNYSFNSDDRQFNDEYYNYIKKLFR